MSYIDKRGNYYEGDRISRADIEVPPRPTGGTKWNGREWVGQPSRSLVHRLITEDEFLPEGLRIWSHMKLNSPGIATDLFTALTGSGEEEVLQWNIRSLLATIIETLEQLGKPLSQGQLQRVDEILSEANFEWTIDDLGVVDEPSP